MRTIYKNKEKSEEILSEFFSIPPILTSIIYDDRSEIYFIEVRTTPLYLKSTWQYRKYIGCCFGRIYNGDICYDFSGTYSKESMLMLNNVVSEAIAAIESEPHCSLCKFYWNNGEQMYCKKLTKRITARKQPCKHYECYYGK